MVKRRKRNKKWISWLIILVLLVAAGVVAYLVWDRYFNEKKPEPTETEIIVQENIAQGEEKIEKVEEIEEKPKAIQYDGDNPNNNNALTGAVTYSAVAGNSYLIRVNIDQYLSSGTCELKLMAGGASIYTDTANIVSSASTATCEGFNIPLSQVSSGNYKILIDLKSGDKTGKIEGEASI